MVAARRSGLYLRLLEQGLGSVFFLGCRLFVLLFLSLQLTSRWRWSCSSVCPPVDLGTCCAPGPLQAGWLCWPSPVPRVGKTPGYVQSSWRRRCMPASAGSIGPAV